MCAAMRLMFWLFRLSVMRMVAQTLIDPHRSTSCRRQPMVANPPQRRPQAFPPQPQAMPPPDAASTHWGLIDPVHHRPIVASA